MMPIVRLLAVLGVLAIVGVAVGLRRTAIAPPSSDVSPRATGAPVAQGPMSVDVRARGLRVPWAIAFGPDSELYVTEREGRVLRIQGDRVETLALLTDVAAVGEAGLLGLALDPQFATNRFLYVYYTTRRGRTRLENRVVRYTVTENGLTHATVIVRGVPGALIHDGGRIAFGPDGNLYVATGDANQAARAQDLTSLAGKILRLRPDGSVPSDNPFPGSPVYSLGHRNPQGLAWDRDGHLYITEHGPSSGPPDCCHDEVNLIKAGKNYGWPARIATQSVAGGPPSGKLGVPGLEDPVVESGPAETWAPAGAAIVGETFFFGGLRGKALFALDLRNPTRVAKHLEGEFGRIRDVVVGPDGALYLTTSNRDGRGDPRPGDDQILRVDPKGHSLF